MPVTSDTIRARFPEFSDTSEFPTDRINMFIEDAKILYIGDSESRWMGRYDIALSYLSAHLLDRATSSEAGDSSSKSGSISSKSAGGVSISRSATVKDRSDTDDFLMSTSYGQAYISIRNMTFIGIATVN